MRKKSENEARDRYARCYAAVLVAEAMIRYHNRGHAVTFTLEAEGDPLWDDIDEIRGTDGTANHRHQVKRQQTPLTAEAFSLYVDAAAKGNPQTHYHFANPVLISVGDVGEIRVLKGLIRRVRQDEVNHLKVLENLYSAEQIWIDWLKKITNLSETDVLALLKRLHVDILGYEEELEERALRSLRPTFGDAAEEAWNAISKYVSDKDGVVAISPERLWERMPARAMDEIDGFYWSMIGEIEKRFWLDRWPDLSDSLNRNLLPVRFLDDVAEMEYSVKTAAWRERYPGVEQSIKNLINRAVDYARCFQTRSELRDKCLAEDNSYWRTFPDSNDEKELEASKRWDQEVHKRFHNLVVALNEVFASVRSEMRSSYRLQEGCLAIHDYFGVRHQGLTSAPVYDVPKDYITVEETTQI